MVHPDPDDVVIRQRHGNGSTVYLLGTPSALNQFILRTREEAVSHALAYATYQHVRAWFDDGHDNFVLLGTFRRDTTNRRGNRDGDISQATVR